MTQPTLLLGLGRTLQPVAPKQPIPISCFTLEIQIQEEDGQQVAWCAPIEGALAGVGDSPNAALDNFVECFTMLVDLHIERNTLEDFLKAHPGSAMQHELRELEILSEQERELFLTTYPAWNRAPYPNGDSSLIVEYVLKN